MNEHKQAESADGGGGGSATHTPQLKHSYKMWRTTFLIFPYNSVRPHSTECYASFVQANEVVNCGVLQESGPNIEQKMFLEAKNFYIYILPFKNDKELRGGMQFGCGKNFSDRKILKTPQTPPKFE